MKTLRIAGIVKQSIVDGPGLRLTVFTQGCPHRCAGCHNEETWPLEGGTLVKAENILKEFNKNPILQGITFSGGEPLIQAKELLPLAREVKQIGKDIVCFTGYTFEELLGLQEENLLLKELLSLMDILVDGRFDQGERDLTLQFRGSRNQRILTLPESLKAGKPILIEKYM